MATVTPAKNGRASLSDAVPIGTAAAPAGNKVAFVIPELNIKTAIVRLRGTAPLILHAWSQKALKMMQDNQSAKPGMKAKKQREARDPKADFEGAKYVSSDGWEGVPTVAFKGAMVGAARQVEGLSMVMARRSFFTVPDGTTADGYGLTRIVAQAPARMRTDTVRLDSGAADMRYRPEYFPWSVSLTVKWNAALFGEDQLLNLIAHAGAWEGIGEWRPSSPESDTGTYGTWEIER